MIGIIKSAEFKVGALVLAVSSIIGVMSMRVSEDPTLGGAQRVWFKTPNANGLVKNSSVKMAGIPVGVIKDIRLKDGQALIEMVIKDDVPLKKSASVELKSNGILGDKFLEIMPGAETDEPLADGGQILRVQDSGSLDNVMAKVGEIAGTLSKVAENLKEAVDGDGTNAHVLGRIVQNIEQLTSDLSQMTSENKAQIGDIVSDIRGITRGLNDVLSDKQSGFKESWARLNASLENLESITAKVNRGEGTIGKLINDETTIENINSAVENVNEFLGTASKMQTALDFHTEYLSEQENFKSYIGVKLQPGLDRYYLLQVVDDPVGVVKKTNTVTVVDGGPETIVDETKTFKNEVKFTLLFAKNFWDFTVRGGLIENSGGLGFDYHFFRRRLTLSMDLFEFANMNARLSAKYNVWKGIYVTGGVNDALNKQDKLSGYLGAGLFLTNDDVKVLLTKVPF